VADFPYARIQARAARDSRFRRQLIAKPRAALKEIGIDVPDDVDVQVVVDTLDKVHAVLPVVPGWRGPETGLLGTVLERTRGDPKFRELVRSDPRAAYTEITGFELPDRPSLVVVAEDRGERIIHLLPVEARHLESFEDVQAMWGGPLYNPTGTYESGEVCNCFTDELDSVVTTCCIPETEGPMPG
jgi:hypothetical protein